MGMIGDEHLKGVCKPGTTECCRYVVCGPEGFECVKDSASMKALLDGRVVAGTIRATGDNCEGV